MFPFRQSLSYQCYSRWTAQPRSTRSQLASLRHEALWRMSTLPFALIEFAKCRTKALSCGSGAQMNTTDRSRLGARNRNSQARDPTGKTHVEDRIPVGTSSGCSAFFWRCVLLSTVVCTTVHSVTLSHWLASCTAVASQPSPGRQLFLLLSRWTCKVTD